MTTEAWIQILIAVSIVAVISLVVLIYRLLDVLRDVKEVTEIASTRAKEIDAKIDEAEKKIGSLSDMIKGFVRSLDIVRIVRDKFNSKAKEK